MLPDRADARARVERERRRLWVCRLAHEAMPLTVYYRSRWAG
jgi:hypothetical protein